VGDGQKFDKNCCWSFLIWLQNGLQKVDLKILLPTHEVVAVSVCKSSTTPDVYNAVTEKIGLDKNTSQYFAIFEIVEYNFGKKPAVEKTPHLQKKKSTGTTFIMFSV